MMRSLTSLLAGAGLLCAAGCGPTATHSELPPGVTPLDIARRATPGPDRKLVDGELICKRVTAIIDKEKQVQDRCFVHKTDCEEDRVRDEEGLLGKDVIISSCELARTNVHCFTTERRRTRKPVAACFENSHRCRFWREQIALDSAWSFTSACGEITPRSVLPQASNAPKTR